MRKYILLLFAGFFLFSCNDARTGADPEELMNVTAEPRIGSVVLKWDNPVHADYYYTLVTYVDSKGDTIRRKISKYAVDPEKGEGHTRAVIDGFEDTATYTFTLVPYTVDGWPAGSVAVSCAPEDASNAYKYVAATTKATPVFEGGIVSWENEWKIPVVVNISFKDLLGETRNLRIDSDKSESVEVVAFVDPTEITVITENAKGDVSEPAKVTVTPLGGEIPHTRLAVADIISEWQEGVNRNKLIDGDVKTAWHSALHAGYPVWYVIDLGAAHRINWIELVRRNDDPNCGPYAPDHVKLEYSLDNASFTEIGTFEFNRDLIYNHAYNFDPVTARYVKVTQYNEDYPDKRGWSHMAEITFYNAEAATHWAEEAAAELVPDPDDDPTYYADIEYIVPWYEKLESNPGWFNNITIEQTNPDNPSEWTYKTTGGDSWLPMIPVRNQIAGSVLVFQYKCSAAIQCEFFWCPGGFGVDGHPASGKETEFNLSKTANWKTFKKNFASDFQKHGWNGAPGDQVRFDVGNGADVTLVVRNMHWRQTVEGE